MTDAPLNLGLGSSIGQDGLVSNTRHINCYVEDSGTEAKQRFTIYTCPGLTRFDNGTYTGVSRGLIQLNDNALIAFLGNEVVSVDTGGSVTTLGTLVGSGRVSLARNRAAAPQIAVITSGGQYHILQSGTIAQINDVDLPVPNSVAYLKGFFVFSIPDGRLYQSDLDASNVGALAFDSANSRSEGLVRVFTHAGFLYAFGKKTTEIWQADASLASEPFVFSPIQQDIDLGCIAPQSVTQIGTGLAWVDDDGLVRYGRDGGAQRISNHGLERAIENLSNASRALIAGRQWFHQGHEFYTLFADDFTWTYDVLTQQWHERQSYGSSTWLASDIVAFDGNYIAGSSANGALYKIDSGAYDEDGEALIMDVRAPVVHNFPSGYIADNIEIDAIMGVGTAATASGVHFSSDSDFVTFGDVLDQTGSFTIEAIINPQDITTPSQRIVSKDIGSGGTGWIFSLGDAGAGSIRFLHRELPGSETDAFGVAVGEDQHVAAVFDNAANTATVYVNGVQGSQTTGLTATINTNAYALLIGNSQDASNTRNFNGFIRDVRIWNTARSAAQIAANMFTTLTGSESGLVGYWKLDEETGSIANDSSASNFDGTLTGSAQWSSLYWEPTSNPLIMVDYSDDGGKNFVGERTASLGALGQYNTKIRMNKWGHVKESGRQWRIRASAAVLRGIIGATIDARPIR